MLPQLLRLRVIYRSSGIAYQPIQLGRHQPSPCGRDQRSPRVSQRHFHPSFPMRLTLSGVSSLNGAEGQKVRTLEAI